MFRSVTTMTGLAGPPKILTTDIEDDSTTVDTGKL